VTTQTSTSQTHSASSVLEEKNRAPHICVCICTFRRRELLTRLLNRLHELQFGLNRFTLSCVVVDNDEEKSAQEVVSSFQKLGKLEFVYKCEPERNFAVVRNQAVRAAKGDYIAFIDDDEVPEADWLLRLLEIFDEHKCDGVLGPVRPYYEKDPPRWLVKSGLCDRPPHPTGLKLNWQQTRSGNVLLKRDIFEPGGIMFDPVYRTGGEDVDFFKRAIAAGRKFVWCEEAPAYEIVPLDRMRLAYHLRRALLQGGISLKYGVDQNNLAERVKIGLKSFIALAIYSLILPFLILGGYRPFIRFLVKICHHLGRFSAVCGRPILRERKL
jgi:succinoglycan biosynthesis protein ExoM